MSETFLRAMAVAAVGTAAFGAVAPPSAQAGKAGKKARKRCKRQVGACRQAVTDHCMGNAGCLETNLPFCEPFARCNGGAGLVRIFIAD